MALPQAASSPGYRPRAASNPFKEIVNDHIDELFRVWDERFRAEHGSLHKRVRDLADAFLRCGDPHFGFLRLKCCNPECPSKTEKILPFSCKARALCPSCSKKRALLWAERMVEEVLPKVPYVQLVFTMPKMLRKAFLFDRSLYGELCRAAYQATLDFLREHFPALKRAVPAMVVSPQSFGSLLNHHAHAHAVVSLGLFDPQGTFHPLPEDFDFAPLGEIFLEHTFKALLKKEAVTKERVEILRTWRHSGFHVDASRRVAAEDRKGLESLLEYMERAPVALERLTYLDDGQVLYRGNYHPGLGRDHQLVSGLEFLALALPHVLLRFEITSRSYGAVSTTTRRRLGWIKKAEAPGGAPTVAVVEGEDSEFMRVRRRNWARLIARVWLENPSLCPTCGKEMKVLAAVSSPAQDDVIEKILRARGEWSPPWLYARSARGPPGHPVSPQPQKIAEEAWIDPPPTHEDELGDQGTGDNLDL
mgnify:FL=1